MKGTLDTLKEIAKEIEEKKCFALKKIPSGSKFLDLYARIQCDVEKKIEPLIIKEDFPDSFTEDHINEAIGDGFPHKAKPWQSGLKKVIMTKVLGRWDN